MKQLSERARASFGQPIGELMARALGNPELISLAAGFADQSTLPTNLIQQVFDGVFADEPTARRALQYGTTAGDPLLRQLLIERLLSVDPGLSAADHVTPDQVVVTAGSNEFLFLLADALLDPGDIVLCGSPTYLVMLGILENLQAVAWGVNTDENGIRSDDLHQVLDLLQRQGRIDRVKAIYVVSYFDNPGGISMSLERRQELLDVARAWSARIGRTIHIIEDVAYRQLRYEGEDVPSIRSLDQSGQQVVYVDTFSKCLSPGLRVGWGLLPPPLVEPIINLKGNLNFGSPHLNQMILQRFLRDQLDSQHVPTIRQGYREKLEALETAAEELLAPVPGVHWHKPTGGLYIWLGLSPSIDTGPQGSLFDHAIEEGMIYVPGEFAFPNQGEPRCRNFMRLSFAVESPQRIRQGVEALSRAISRTLDEYRAQV